MSEEQLIAQARTGDQDAFGRLVELYKERVYAVAFQMTHSHSDADELSQTAFVKAFQSIGKFHGGSSFYTWIYRITVNACLTFLKGRGRTVPLPDPNSDEESAPEMGAPDPADRSMEHDELQAQVWKGLEQLAPEIRAAVVMVYLQDLSPKEAAVSLDCAEATVHWRLFRARKILRSYFGGKGGL